MNEVSKVAEVLSNIQDSEVLEVGSSVFFLSKLLQDKLPIVNSFAVYNSFFSYLVTSNTTSSAISALSMQSASSFIDDKVYIAKENIDPELINQIQKAYNRISGFTEVSVEARLVFFDEAGNPLKGSGRVSISNLKGLEAVINGVNNVFLKFLAISNVKIDSINTKKYNFAVLVQKTLNPEIHGTIYTSDVLTNNASSVLIEALYGVPINYDESEEVPVPDQYIVNKSDQKVLEKHIATQKNMYIRQLGAVNSGIQKVEISDYWQKKQKLDDKYISHLVTNAKLIEESNNNPVVISWIFESGKLFIRFIEELENNNKQQQDSTAVDTVEQGTANTDSHEGLIEQHPENTRPSPAEANENINPEITNNNHNNVVQDEDRTKDSEDYDIGNTQGIGGNQIEEEITKAIYYDGSEEVVGKVVFNIADSDEESILVLKGDEDLPMDVKFAALIIEDESRLLVERLHKHFQKTVLSGVAFAREILKSGESIHLKEGKIYGHSPNVIHNNVISEKEQSNTKKTDQPDTINPNIKTNFDKNVEEFVQKVEEDDAKNYKNYAYVATNDAEEVKGLNENTAKQLVEDRARHIVEETNAVDANVAIENIEGLLEFKGDLETHSPEFNFDEEESYIEELTYKEIEKASKVKSIYSGKFIPTATKIYLNLIDSSIDKGLINYDGVVVSSTLDIPEYIYLIDQVIKANKEKKELIIVIPPYEIPALKKFLAEIGKIKKKFSGSLGLVLPDYRNKQNIVNYKLILGKYGLRRRTNLKIYANVSNMLNVFRLSELSHVLVDGIYFDMFRLKLNMLGVNKNTASSRFVIGMKKLNEYIAVIKPHNLESIISLNGFNINKSTLQQIAEKNYSRITVNAHQIEDVKSWISTFEKNKILR